MDQRQVGHPETLMCKNVHLMEKYGGVNNRFSPVMMFALDLHLAKITDVAIITAIIFNLLPPPFPAPSWTRSKPRTRLQRLSPWILSVIPGIQIRWAAGHLLQCSHFLKSLAHLLGSYHQSLCGICMISYAMSITSVISYATVNIRAAVSDGGEILHDLPLVKSLYSFGFSGQRAGPRVLEVCVSVRHSVRSSPSSRDGKRSGQLPMSECPGSEEMAKRQTHSCLLTLAWLTVSAPLESHGHASLVTMSETKWYLNCV